MQPLWAALSRPAGHHGPAIQGFQVRRRFVQPLLDHAGIVADVLWPVVVEEGGRLIEAGRQGREACRARDPVQLDATCVCGGVGSRLDKGRG